MIQNIAYYTFATYAPGYGQLQPDNVLKAIHDALYGQHGCVAKLENCYAAGSTVASQRICREADEYLCMRDIHLFADATLMSDRQTNRIGISSPLQLETEARLIFAEPPMHRSPRIITKNTYAIRRFWARSVLKLPVRTILIHASIGLRRQEMYVYVLLGSLDA